MYAARQLLLRLVKDRGQFARVPHVTVEFELSTNMGSIRAPCVPANTPVERVSQKAAVQVRDILLVQRAERHRRTRLPSNRGKHTGPQRRSTDELPACRALLSRDNIHVAPLRSELLSH